MLKILFLYLQRVLLIPQIDQNHKFTEKFHKTNVRFTEENIIDNT